MKNVFLRLCGGFSVMIRPENDIHPDFSKLEPFNPTYRSDSMIKFRWEGIDVTMYHNGGLIFYHFEDQELAEQYALRIYEVCGLKLAL